MEQYVYLASSPLPDWHPVVTQLGNKQAELLKHCLMHGYRSPGRYRPRSALPLLSIARITTSSKQRSAVGVSSSRSYSAPNCWRRTPSAKSLTPDMKILPAIGFGTTIPGIPLCHQPASEWIYIGNQFSSASLRTAGEASGYTFRNLFEGNHLTSFHSLPATYSSCQKVPLERIRCSSLQPAMEVLKHSVSTTDNPQFYLFGNLKATF